MLKSKKLMFNIESKYELKREVIIDTFLEFLIM
jgi:hypothetical protein